MDGLNALAQASEVAVAIVAFVVVVSIVVTVHEFGHYLVGRLCGIAARVFSIGFGTTLWTREGQDGTTWRIAAIPLGGYVKFAAPDDAEPATSGCAFDDAPLWARTATVAAGPAFNFVFALVVLAAAAMVQGRTAEPVTVADLKPMPVVGVTLAPGDQIESVAGRALSLGDGLAELERRLPLEPLLDYRVVRAGRTMTVLGPHPLLPLIARVAPRSAALKAGFEKGDVIVAVDGDPIASFRQFKEIVEGSGGRTLETRVWRGGATLDIPLTPKRVDVPLAQGGFETVWRVGLGGGLAFEAAREPVGPVDAAKLSARAVWRTVKVSVSGLYNVVTGGISACNITGPVGLANISADIAADGLGDFVRFLALVSIAIGLVNLLPVPVMDGGHLALFAWEAASGRRPGERARRWLAAFGMALILTLGLFALANDLACL